MVLSPERSCRRLLVKCASRVTLLCLRVRHICLFGLDCILFHPVDPRTACFWQVFISEFLLHTQSAASFNIKLLDQQQLMMDSFKIAMAKLQTLGQPSNLIDCSDVRVLSFNPKSTNGPVKGRPCSQGLHRVY
jgi:hypothetical protein